jgi:hypothetical protein
MSLQGSRFRAGLALLGGALTLAPGSAAATETNATHFVAPDFQQRVQAHPVYTIAVLPMESMVVHDPVVSELFRDRVIEHLRARGYTVTDPGRIDAALHRLGVAHEGQLNRLSFAQLGEITAAQAFLSGAVEEAGPEHQVVANSYVYTCSLKLQDRRGDTLWHALQERVAKLRIAIDPFNMLLDAMLVEQGGNERQAIRAVADRLLASLPDGPVQVLFGDNLLDQARTIPITTPGNRR